MPIFKLIIQENITFVFVILYSYDKITYNLISTGLVYTNVFVLLIGQSHYIKYIKRGLTIQ